MRALEMGLTLTDMDNVSLKFFLKMINEKTEDYRAQEAEAEPARFTTDANEIKKFFGM